MAKEAVVPMEHEVIKCADIDDSIRFMMTPMSLFTNPIYESLTNDARLLYAFLRNRVTLSQENGWVLPTGEVFIYCTRQEAALFLKISESSSKRIFKSLVDVGLIREKRQGLNKPNIIFVCRTKGML